MGKWHGETTQTSTNTISVSGSFTAAEVTGDSSAFSGKVVVLSFKSVSTPWVSYTPPGSLVGIDAAGNINKTFKIDKNAGLPSGPYDLTIQLPNNQIRTLRVSVG